MDELKGHFVKLKEFWDSNNSNQLEEEIQRYISFLLSNFSNENLANLNNESLTHLEFCCSVLEYSCFHTNFREISLTYVISEIINKYPGLNFLKLRIDNLNRPIQISHIETEWQASIELFLQNYLNVKNESNILSTHGNTIFYDRVGIAVINKYLEFLKNINLAQEFMKQVPKYLMDNDELKPHTTKVLGWLHKKNDSRIIEGLFKI